MTMILRYLAVGGVNTVLGYAVIIACMTKLGMGPVVANSVGYLVGFAWSFLFNRRWTFGSSGHIGGDLLRYALVATFGYGVNVIVLVLSHYWMGMPAYGAQALGIAAYLAIVFTGSWLFAFPVVDRPKP